MHQPAHNHNHLQELGVVVGRGDAPQSEHAQNVITSKEVLCSSHQKDDEANVEEEMEFSSHMTLPLALHAVTFMTVSAHRPARTSPETSTALSCTSRTSQLNIISSPREIQERNDADDDPVYTMA